MPEAYTEESGRARTFAAYRAAVDANPLDMGFPSQEVQVSDSEARQMLRRTWELSLDLLERRGAGPVRAMPTLLSCLADAPVPYEMLLPPPVLAESDVFPSSLTADETWRALLGLADTGLLDLSAPEQDEDVPVLRLHPLVRDVSHPREDEARHLATAARLLVNATHGAGRRTTRPPGSSGSCSRPMRCRSSPPRARCRTPSRRPGRTPRRPPT